MAFVVTHAGYREALGRLGLSAPADFLRLQGVILGGHRDRHVSRVVLEGELPVFLKREHRVRWRDRLRNALSGFGFTSRSYREFVLLGQLEQAGIPCPQAIAAGEDGRGRAFLLVRELEDAVELREYLVKRIHASAAQRRLSAADLGAALAQIHAAGFDHPDLFAKHVQVQGTAGERVTFAFLDWQRSRPRRRVSWRTRWRDLAALDATLADELVSPRERLRCLRAYLSLSFSRESRTSAAALVRDSRLNIDLARAACEIRRRAERLLAKRRVREQRQSISVAEGQRLIWLDGEALCVTPKFHEELRQCDGGDALRRLRAPAHRSVERESLPRRAEPPAHLIRRRQFRPLAWLWARLRGTDVATPEIEHAGKLFRLQRQGIATPRLLAVGQQHAAPGRLTSFLLTEPIADTVLLRDWLRARREPIRRRHVIARAAEVVRSLHGAGFYLCCYRAARAGELLRVRERSHHLDVVLGDSGSERRSYRQPRRRDFAGLREELASACRRTEQLRFLLHYFEERHVTGPMRRLIRSLLGKQRPARRSRP